MGECRQEMGIWEGIWRQTEAGWGQSQNEAQHESPRLREGNELRTREDMVVERGEGRDWANLAEMYDSKSYHLGRNTSKKSQHITISLIDALSSQRKKRFIKYVNVMTK